MPKGEKRKVSLLIPFQIKNGKILVYLQKRTKDAERLPDFYGFWGGGAENGESPEDTLRREIEEELNIMPKGYEFLGKYEFDNEVKHAFILETDDSFEGRVRVLEGEYGKYFQEEEALSEPKFIEDDKVVLRDFFKLIKTRLN